MTNRLAYRFVQADLPHAAPILGRVSGQTKALAAKSRGGGGPISILRYPSPLRFVSCFGPMHEGQGQ
jgi:hypothetical protein